MTIRDYSPFTGFCVALVMSALFARAPAWAMLIHVTCLAINIMIDRSMYAHQGNRAHRNTRIGF